MLDRHPELCLVQTFYPLPTDPQERHRLLEIGRVPSLTMGQLDLFNHLVTKQRKPPITNNRLASAVSSFIKEISKFCEYRKRACRCSRVRGRVWV